MNRDNLERLFQNYIEHFERLNNPENNEKYKWDAVEQVQRVWDLSAPDVSEMIKRAFSQSFNLINNRIVQPVSGLSTLARVEPEPVRATLGDPLMSTDDNDEKQSRVLTFVDEINGLLEKHFPGKWKYTQDVRASLGYLSMIKPSENYMFKATPVQHFARYMEYGGDIGSGQTFSLRNYYAMCDELVEHIRTCPELMEKDRTRAVHWRDESFHILAYDLIYCFSVYALDSGMKTPAPKGKASDLQQRRYREQQAAELNNQIDGLQDQIDAIQRKINALPSIRFEGQSMRTRAFGMVKIERQEGAYLVFSAGGKERKFILPGCISNGFLIPEEAELVEQCKEQMALADQIAALENQQKLLSNKLRQLET